MPTRPRTAFTVMALLGAMGLSACGHQFLRGEFPDETGIVLGFVSDRGANPPAAVAGADVYTFPASVRGVTDAAGFFRLEDVRPGFYDLKVTRGPGENLAASIEVTGGGTTRQDFEYDPAFLDVERELIFLTSSGPTGQVATARSPGAFLAGELGIIPVAGLGGTFRSLRMSRVTTAEALVMSNFDHPEDPTIFDVYLLAIAGTQAVSTRVTRDSVPKDFADLSPDGTQIVLSQDTDGDGFFELWILNRDGTSQRRFVDDLDAATGQEFDNRHPDWSPEGSHIAFITRRTDGASPFDQTDFEVVASAVSGGPRMAITRDIDPASHPHLATRDTLVVYERTIGGLRQVFLAPVAAEAPQTQLTILTTDQTDPVVSNDRRMVAWVTRDNIGGTNPDQSPEVTAGELVGGRLMNVFHVTRTEAGLNLDYNSVQWRLR